MAAKRRLKVLSNASNDDPPPRPPWHWTIISGVLYLLVWLIVASLANSLLATTANSSPPGGAEFTFTMSVHLGAFAVSGALSGFVIGWQSSEAKIGFSSFGGVMAASMGIGSAVLSPGGSAVRPLWWLLVFAGLGAFGFLSFSMGFRRGRRRAQRAAKPSP